MIEGIPRQPYGSLVQHLNIVEDNMSFRRSQIQSLLQPDEIVLSLTNFPRCVKNCGEGKWGMKNSVDYFYPVNIFIAGRLQKGNSESSGIQSISYSMAIIFFCGGGIHCGIHEI